MPREPRARKKRNPRCCKAVAPFALATLALGVWLGIATAVLSCDPWTLPLSSVLGACFLTAVSLTGVPSHFQCTTTTGIGLAQGDLVLPCWGPPPTIESTKSLTSSTHRSASPSSAGAVAAVTSGPQVAASAWGPLITISTMSSGPAAATGARPPETAGALPPAAAAGALPPASAPGGLAAT